MSWPWPPGTPHCRWMTPSGAPAGICCCCCCCCSATGRSEPVPSQTCTVYSICNVSSLRSQYMSNFKRQCPKTLLPLQYILSFTHSPYCLHCPLHIHPSASAVLYTFTLLPPLSFTHSPFCLGCPLHIHPSASMVMYTFTLLPPLSFTHSPFCLHGSVHIHPSASTVLYSFTHLPPLSFTHSPFGLYRPLNNTFTLLPLLSSTHSPIDLFQYSTVQSTHLYTIHTLLQIQVCMYCKYGTEKTHTPPDSHCSNKSLYV